MYIYAAHLLKYYIKIILNIIYSGFRVYTLVIPIAPMFSLYEVVPFPDPHAPARIHPIPSIPIPLFIAWVGGGGAPDSLAHA